MNSSRAKPATPPSQEQLLALVERYHVLQERLQPIDHEIHPDQDVLESLRIKIQTGRRMMQMFEEERARLAQQMHALSHTIKSSYSQGKAAMFITPSCHCVGGGCS